MNIKKLVKKEVAGLRAYNAKEVPCRIKLDANESPYGISGALKAAGRISTNRYPDPEANEFKKLLSRQLGIKPANILQGNGSDELIYYLITAFGGPVLFPVPTFSMYGIIAQALGENKVPVGLDENFDLNTADMLAAIKKHRPKLIFLSSPNNPTGNCFSAERILAVVEASKGIVVIDEAYQPFSSERGFLPLLKDYKNVVILRTLSKIGLAAIRLGYMIGHPEIVEEVNKVRLPFNVNSLSQAVAVAALGDTKKLRGFIKGVVAERDRMLGKMSSLAGVTVFQSEANFILFKVEDPAGVYASLLKAGILVRDLDDVVKGCLRVTIGTRAENAAFFSALKKILSK
ncbi:MAG: histidinol-phosphate transaminase [Nitrospirae bacterium]|nr:histidinol-phosphate transaminase [Nitrospirota bacterium]